MSIIILQGHVTGPSWVVMWTTWEQQIDFIRGGRSYKYSGGCSRGDAKRTYGSQHRDLKKVDGKVI